MKWFIKGIRNYVNFSGRARRKEYWNFFLFAFILNLVFRLVDMVLFEDKATGAVEYPVFSALFSLFIFLPNLAVSVRRLHDTGRSGKNLVWFYIAAFVWAVLFISCIAITLGNLSALPLTLLVILWGATGGILVWGIFFLVWFCTPGTSGDNKYGPDPKMVEEV